MEKRVDFLKIILILIFTGLLVTGCAAIKKHNTADTEKLLSAAGFTMHPADTAEKMAHLKNQPQLKIVPRQKDGKMYYTYADVQYAKALFVGNEVAFQHYQNISIQKHNAEEEEVAPNMDWDGWGPVWGGLW
jgi:uncharacterized protein YceK